MFFDLPSDKTCIHPEHEPPTGLYIPPGKGYRHVCPACKTVKDVIPPDYSLTLPDPVRRTVVQGWKLVPVEPTDEWISAVSDRGMRIGSLESAIRDMLAAAPTPPTQAADSVLEDAARYRFLAAHCRRTSEHWGGRWSIIVDGPAPALRHPHPALGFPHRHHFVSVRDRP